MNGFNDGAAATWTSEITLREIQQLLATAAEGWDELRIRVEGRGYAVSYGGVHVSASSLPVAMRRLFEIHKDRVRLHGGRAR